MKDVLVTGAYGGMGRAIVKALCERGYRVLALDKDTDEPQENVIPIKADITSPEQISAAYHCATQHTNTLFAIVHLAGVYMLDSLAEMSNHDFDRIISINLRGAFLINKTFLPLMKSGGRIIMVTSELATVDPLPFTGIYTVTKSALDKYAYSLAMELQLKGIRVSVLRAGAVSTDMLGVSTAALDRFCKNTKLYTCNADRFKKIVEGVEARSIPPQRLAKKAISLLEAKRPPFARSINRNPLLVLLSILPKRLQLFIIKAILK